MLLTAAVWCASASALAVPETATVLANGSSATTDWTTETLASSAASATESPPTIVVYNSTGGEDDSRDSRFLSFTMGSDQAAGTVTNSLLQEKQDDPTTTDPSAHLVDIYTDCLMQLSFPCVQRKLLLFLDKLGRMKGEC